MNNAQLTLIEKQREDILSIKLPKSYKSKSLVPFVGAGFSQNIPSYPSFSNFINDNLALRLCAKLFIDEIDKPDLLKLCKGNHNEAIEYFIWKMGVAKGSYSSNMKEIYYGGKKAFYNEAKVEFDKAEKVQVAGKERFWEQHFLIVENFNTIYTTNWDVALETACDYLTKKRAKKIKCETKYSSNGDIDSRIIGESNSPEKTITIIKYHGDIKVPDSIIASETDYYQRFGGNHKLDIEFKNVLANKDILFIGYSLGDINVKYHMNQIQFLNDAFNREYKRYWLLVDNPDEKMIDEERRKFLSEWRNLEICYLFNGESNEEEKRNKITEVLKIFS